MLSYYPTYLYIVLVIMLLVACDFILLAHYHPQCKPTSHIFIYFHFIPAHIFVIIMLSPRLENHISIVQFIVLDLYIVHFIMLDCIDCHCVRVSFYCCKTTSSVCLEPQNLSFNVVEHDSTSYQMGCLIAELFYYHDY